ncbi:MAG: DUF4838 domain-containing protein [Planctomycetota bacterium]
MKRLCPLGVCLATLIVVLSCSVRAGERVLATGGQSACRIVLPEGADVSTRAVAEDLACVLKEMTGADFPVVTDDSAAGECEIILGAENAHLGALGLTGLADGFAEGEYEIRTAGNHLVIAGGPLRGTINGMYGFLQDHLGCRWCTPGCMRIPKQSDLALPEIRDRQRPAFTWRSTNPCMHWDAAWTARNRLNECKAHGGTVSMMMLMSDPRVATIGNYSSEHQFSYIPKSLYEEHPEYYAEIDGKRTCQENPNERAYCLTNDGFVAYMADVLKRSLRGTTGPHFVGLGHADNANYCRCEACRASYERVGLSGTYMEFDNKVADLVTKEYPQAIISTLAYGITFAPTSVAMHPRVRVVWCPISNCRAHAFDECDPNRDRDFLGQLSKWQANASMLGIWYYHTQSDILMPHMKMHATAGDFRIFRDKGVRTVFVEAGSGASRRSNASFDGDKLLPAYGNAETQGYFTVPLGLQPLVSYLVCRMLWDAEFDWQAGVRDFCTTYYGAAGGELAEFALKVESIDSYEKTIGPTFTAYPGVHESGSLAPKLRWSAIEEMDALFETAMAKVADDANVRRRVELARASLDLAILNFAPRDHALREAAFVRFFALMEELGLLKVHRTAVTGDNKTIPEMKEILSHPEKLAIPGEEAVGANVLMNPSFEAEIDGDGIPDGWNAGGDYLPEEYTVDPGGVMLDASKSHSGKTSVRLTKAPAAKSIVSLRQRFDVTPGKSYRASVSYQADVKAGSIVVIFTAFNREGRWLRHQGGVGGRKATGDQWQKLSVDTRVEDDTAQLMVEFLFYDDRSEGVAWIDDFTCCPVSGR